MMMTGSHVHSKTTHGPIVAEYHLYLLHILCSVGQEVTTMLQEAWETACHQSRPAEISPFYTCHITPKLLILLK